MDKDSFFCLGRISKTFGYKGQVVAILNSSNPEKYKDLESVFVEIQHQRIPFFITEFSLQSKNAVALKFEDIDDQLQAQKLLGCTVFIPVAEKEKMADDTFDTDELIGYKVSDVSCGYIGEISHIMQLPQQYIMQIFQGKKEILVPLNEDFIKKIDPKNKTMLIDAPDGLIGFYQQ